MNSAFGGIANLAFIIVFLTIAIGALGLTVSYSKAFHMKSAIIQTIEEYEGSGCFNGRNENSGCKQRIKSHAKKLTYNPPQLQCPSDFVKAKDYCYQVRNTGNKKVVVRVMVQIDLDFPVIAQISGWKIFRVVGDTKEIELQS